MSSSDKDQSSPIIKHTPVANYKIPYWGAEAGSIRFPYYLEVIREGELLQDEAIDLSQKSYYVLGRQEDMVDALCGNTSISRQHCIIQHAKNGRVYLCDLGSANGTFWNNRKHQCKPQKYIPLWLGNSFIMGMSNRTYILSVKDGMDEQVRQFEDELKKRKTSFEIAELKKKRAEKRKKNYDSDGEEIIEDELPEDYDQNEENRNKRLRIEDQLTSEMFEFDERGFYDDTSKRKNDDKNLSTSSLMESNPTDMEGLVQKQERIKLHLANLKNELQKEIEMIEEQQSKTLNKKEDDDDELEMFMTGINTSLIQQNTQKKESLEREIKQLGEELSKVQDAITKTKPTATDKKTLEHQERDGEIIRDRLTREMFIHHIPQPNSETAPKSLQ